MKKVKTVDILRFLPALFRYADASKLVPNPNVFLSRALKAGYVAHIVRGVYYNTFKEAAGIEEVACFTRTPSYISCEWALNAHGVILQAPAVCSVITLSTSVGKRKRINYSGAVIEYSKISERLFWGFQAMGGYNFASPEKALLDTAYLRRYIPFADELELEHIDKARLMKFAESFPKSVQKRIVSLFS